MKLGIGAKLAFGFGALIVITSILGGIAVWKMNAIGANAQTLDKEFIEEARIASDIGNNLAAAMLQMRTFGLTESQERYDEAMGHFKDVKTGIETAQALAKNAKRLQNLNKQTQDGMEFLLSYMAKSQKTLELVNKLRAIRADLAANAAVFNEESGRYLENQVSKFREEVAANATAKDFDSRLGRIIAANELIALGQASMLATTKAEAQRKQALVDEALKNFSKVSESIETILPITVQAKNKQQLEKCRAANENYKKSILEMQRIWGELEGLQKERTDVSGKLVAACEEIAKDGMSISKSSSAESAKSLASASLIMICGLALALVLAITLSVGITRSVMKPVSRTAEIASSLASQSEELSTVSSSLVSASEEMSSQSGNVAAATEEMSANISAMASASEEMNVNAQSVASASEQMSRNVSNVAGAIEELSASMKMVGEKAKDGVKVAGEAMHSSKGASETMGQLGLAAQEIGQVTETIKRIAEQTNLLALNATIEAASAGDAGRGFAVVANEIKELANQSARAAEDIAKRIRGVQGKTDEAVKAISEVSSVIAKLHETSEAISGMVVEEAKATSEMSSNVAEANTGVNSIASSIKEVAEGTREMSRNAGEAAKGANDVSSNIGEVKTAAGNTSANASQVNSSALELSKLAGELKSIVIEIKGA